MTLMSDSDRIYFPSRPSSHQIPLPFNHSDPAEVAAVTAAVAASSSSFSDDRECKYAYEVSSSPFPTLPLRALTNLVRFISVVLQRNISLQILIKLATSLLSPVIVDTTLAL